jgi:hypothetical protein
MYANGGSGSGAPSNVDPSTFTNAAGFSFDAGQTTWHFRTNDNSGSATTDVDLGANFPTNTASTDWYEWRVWCAPNDNTIYYWIKNVTSGNTAQGSTTTDLPVNTTLLEWVFAINNGSTAAVAGMDLGSVYMFQPY